MPEPKEKEPLLAELEVVGRLPLTQLESNSVVRRSRSWYLCCPNVGDEEISRESSWRYSSLRPVTAAPLPGQNGILMVTSQSSTRDDVSALRAERDSLARALDAERQRAATAARAHDARLAELHGVIAELVRRRADTHARAIPEEDGSDECESTTQPAGELDNDADRSRTEQNDTSSLASPAELPTPQEPRVEDIVDDTTDSSREDELSRCDNPRIEVTSSHHVTDCDTSLNLSERDSELCLNTARCCQFVRKAQSVSVSAGGGSCEREHGSLEAAECQPSPSPGRSEVRRAKVASRVRLRKTEGSGSNNLSTDEWSVEAERLALDVCAQADLREALVAASNDGEALSASVEALKAHCAKLEADNAVIQAALDQATDVVHRLYTFCNVQESNLVQLCVALRAADRTVEAYDVLLALAETEGAATPQRAAAERVAEQLLSRLSAEEQCAPLGQPLLSPGPWLEHDNNAEVSGEWGGREEAALRRHVSALKGAAAALRDCSPALYSHHEDGETGDGAHTHNYSLTQMEAAILLQESASLSERAVSSRRAHTHAHTRDTQCDSSRRRRERHWLDPPPPPHAPHTTHTTHTTHTSHHTHL